MSKYSKSTGPSYTEKQLGSENLGRGIRIYPGKIRNHGALKGRETLEPSMVAQFFKGDAELLVRQTIAIFDKVIRKPKTLRGMSQQAYIDRTKVAAHLWDWLDRVLKDELIGLDAKPEYKRLHTLWLGKIHPYAKYEFDSNAPESDENAKSIDDKTLKRSDAEGRWHKALWRTTADGNPDYAATAKAILVHLVNEEHKIHLGENKKPVLRARKNGEISGLSTRRGESIAKSVTDPRHTKAERRAANGKGALQEWTMADAEMYFAVDVAADIYRLLRALRKRIHVEASLPLDEKPLVRSGLRKEEFGKILHEHFGKIAPAFKAKDAMPRLWSVHNAVRAFYKKLAAGDRLRIALRSQDDDELSRVAPVDRDSLLRALGAKSRNADISEYIRLGKLIVHAADMPADTVDLQGSFDTRMDHFATSDGQSEIKRNEAFTRIWRNAVGLSQRTLKGWVDHDESAKVIQNKEGITIENSDLASAPVVKNVIENLKLDHYGRHATLIFGKKAYGLEVAQNRAAIMTPDDREDQKRLARGFLQLAAEIRNRTNHFTTRPRLARVITSVQPQISKQALGAFKRLLAFDIELQKYILVEDLNRIDVGKYLDEDQTAQLCLEIASFEDAGGVTLPKFMSMLRRVEALAKSDDVELPDTLKRFEILDLENYSKQPAGENKCRVELFRQLYATGFRSWLADGGASGEILQAAINGVLESKSARSSTFQIKQGRHYVYAESWLEDLSQDERKDIAALTAALSARSMADGKTMRNYKPKRALQSDRGNDVEALRQEIFAHLFAAYLKDRKLSWLWTFSEHQNSEVIAITPGMIELPTMRSEDWHSPFYAWLYLVPPDDVSLLRHQFRKTAALEVKAATETDEELVSNLADMDRLMALYTRVQSAGFDGKEHIGFPGLEKALYEDVPYPDDATDPNAASGQTKNVTLFEKVFSEDNEDHHFTVPGTRRGLRQMLRYGHFAVLEGTLKKHVVTLEEVKKFVDRDKPYTGEIFKRRIQLHDKISELTKDSSSDQRQLTQLIAEYEQKAVEAHCYNFDINAARLTEHARLHQLMMRIVGRLTDYSLIWERDRIYMFLGMLYRQLGVNSPVVKLERSDELGLEGELGVFASKRPHIGILLPESLKDIQFAAYETLKLTKPDADMDRGEQLMKAFVEMGFLPLWNSKDGFDLSFFRLHKHLLHGENRKLFERYFEGGRAEHPRDKSVRERAEMDDLSKRDPLYRLGRQQIRNDFAHYNIIGKSWKYEDGNFQQNSTKQVNITYLVNSVRSLLAYDRKLKNAVSQSIARIIEEEGLYISWDMKDDRLKAATVCPRLLPQLSMLRGDLARHGFSLPLASVRYTSMVQALFDFGSGGYREKVKTGKHSKTGKFIWDSIGPLSYPERTLWAPDARVPDKVLYRLPEIGFRW